MPGIAPFPELKPDDGLKLTQQAWDLLISRKAELGLPFDEIIPLCDFIGKQEMILVPVDRKVILEQADLLFRHFYAHRPFKEARYPDARPLEEIASLGDKAAGLGEVEFHMEVLEIFDSVRDAHTGYTLPPPFNGAVAFLPFQMQAVDDGTGKRIFVVSRVMETTKGKGFEHPFFGPGAQITYWNGKPVEASVLAANEVGGNDAVALARGVAQATLRSLAHSRAPGLEEEFVTIGYIPENGAEEQTIQFRWGVAPGVPGVKDIAGSAFSENPAVATLATMEKNLWCPHQMCDVMDVQKSYGDDGELREPEQDSAATGSVDAAAGPVADGGSGATGSGLGATAPKPPPPDLTVVSLIPDVFEFQHSGGQARDGFVQPQDLRDSSNPDKTFGYVRIHNFKGTFTPAGVREKLTGEFRRILGILNGVAKDGLIVDLRGNPGGDVPTAETMLQMLTPEEVDPALFHLANTPAVQSILKHLLGQGGNAPSVPLQEFGKWLTDKSPASEPVTAGQPETEYGKDRNFGQVYTGPVVLLIDGFTYSAADIFSGGFADHGIGTIIGVDATTGGGGASVWAHFELQQRVPDLPDMPDLKVNPLPPGVNMTVAAKRSTRVRTNIKKAIEDIGVEADIPYPPTREDAKSNFRGLFRYACGILSQETVYRIEMLSPPEITADGINLKVLPRNISQLTLSVSANGQDGESVPFKVVPGVEQPLSVSATLPKVGEVLLLMEGRAAAEGDQEGKRVVWTRVRVRNAPPPVVLSRSAQANDRRVTR